MEHCAFCGAETQLHVNNIPECLKCSQEREGDPATKPATSAPDRARLATLAAGGTLTDNLEQP
jgi:hypothetical protein